MMQTLSRRRLFGLITALIGSTALPGRGGVAIAAPAGKRAANDEGSTVSSRIANFIVGTRFEDLPPDVVLKAKAQVAYLTGLAFSGSFNEEAVQLRRVVMPIDRDNPHGATVIGERFQLLPADAAFANCTLMRAIWRDDVMFPSGIHPGIVTLPAALAIGEVNRVSGRALLRALVLGYEVLGKLGSAADGWAAPLPRRPTMIYGAYGPVIAAGCLLGLDQRRMENALGYAANLGMGVPEGGQTDHFYSFIARNGTFAAQLAAAGGAAYSKKTIEGELGLYRSFFGEVPDTLPSLIDRLGSDWEILRAEYKRHHGTGDNTAAIELLLDIVESYDLDISQINRINVFLPASRQARKENFFRGPFASPGQAYSSMPYALARVLTDREVVPGQYSEGAIHEESVLSAMEKLHFTFEKNHRSERYCRVEVHLEGGDRRSRETNGFMFAFPPEEWGAWLRQDGSRLLPADRLRRLEEAILDLDGIADSSELMALMRSSNRAKGRRTSERAGSETQ